MKKEKFNRQIKQMHKVKLPYYKFLNPTHPLIATGAFHVGKFPVSVKTDNGDLLEYITIEAQCHNVKLNKNDSSALNGKSSRRKNNSLKK